MITNERQHRITKAELRKFEEAIAAHEMGRPSPDVDPKIYAAMGDALRSEAAELRRQLQAYERLRAGRVKQRNLRSLRELPRAIIEARIAARVTQKELAGRLGVAEQQIQRWEASEYAGVSVQRMQQIAHALGVRITETVRFQPAAKTSRSASPASTARRHAGRGSSRVA